jgi:hypothetical protein
MIYVAVEVHHYVHLLSHAYCCLYVNVFQRQAFTTYHGLKQDLGDPNSNSHDDHSISLAHQ